MCQLKPKGDPYSNLPSKIEMCIVQLSGSDVILWTYSPTGSCRLCPGVISTSTVFSPGCRYAVKLPPSHGDNDVVVGRLAVGIVADVVVGLGMVAVGIVVRLI